MEPRSQADGGGVMPAQERGAPEGNSVDAATEGPADSGESLVRLVDRGLRDVEDRLCRHVDESLRQLLVRSDVERDTQNATILEVQKELASHREGTRGMLAELQRDLGTMQEAVYSKCMELTQQVSSLYAEKAQYVEQAKVVVDSAEGSLKGQLKQYIDHLRGEMEASAAGRSAEATPGIDEHGTEMRALLEEERGCREAQAAALHARLEALEATTHKALEAAMTAAKQQEQFAGSEAAAEEERMAAEAQLTALCTRLEAISREVTSRSPPAAQQQGAGLGEAEAQAMLARVEAVEALCQTLAASLPAGAVEALSSRLEDVERQVASLAAGALQPAPAPKQEAPLDGSDIPDAEASPAGAPAAAERALAMKLAALERDQGVGAATSALSCGLARCIGEFDAELRVELTSKIDCLREELRTEAQAEASAQSCNTEGKLKQHGAEFEAKLRQLTCELEAKIHQATVDTEAKICQAAADTEVRLGRQQLQQQAEGDVGLLGQRLATLEGEVRLGRQQQQNLQTEGEFGSLGQRVAALEGEARRTSYLITQCIGELSGSRISCSDSAGGKDTHRTGETATTASTPTGVLGTDTPGSVRALAGLSSEEGRSVSGSGPHGKDASLGHSVKQLSDVSTDEGHGWEATQPSQRLRGLSGSASVGGLPRTYAPSRQGAKAPAALDTSPPHRRGDAPSIHTLPQGGAAHSGGAPTPVETGHGSVCSSDTVVVAQSSMATGLQMPAVDEVTASGRRRVVMVPVAATGRSVSPEVRARGAALRQTTPTWRQQGQPSGVPSGMENMSLEERQRFLAEISSLRRENSSLRDEVIDSREQALRYLRSNAERALRQQAGPGGPEAEGPVVAAPAAVVVPGAAQSPSAPLRAGFHRSTSPVPPSARVHIMPQASARTPTPARRGLMMGPPGSPPNPLEVATTQSPAVASRAAATSPTPRLSSAPQTARVGFIPHARHPGSGAA